VVLYENEIEPEAPEVSTLAVEEIELGGVSLRVLESCHSIWIFEPGRMRFRRVPRGTRLDMPSPESEWTPYFRLEVEPSSGAFAVGLNQDDTRVLRSWLHIEPCRHCAGDQTGEVSLDAIRRQIDSRPPAD
jgi:hypothetical protein